MHKYLVEFEKDQELTECTHCPINYTHKYWHCGQNEHYFCGVAKRTHDQEERPDWCPLMEVDPQCNFPSISEELVDDYKRLGVKPEEVAADIEWINSSIRKAFEQVKERVLRDYSAKKEVESKCNSKT